MREQRDTLGAGGRDRAAPAGGVRRRGVRRLRLLLRLRRGWSRHSRGERCGQPLPRSGPRLQRAVLPAPGLWPLQPRSLTHVPTAVASSSRATPAARGAAAGRFCAGASCSRRDWVRAHFPPAPGSPPPSTCSETRGQTVSGARAQHSPAHAVVRFSSSLLPPPCNGRHLRRAHSKHQENGQTQLLNLLSRFSIFPNLVGGGVGVVPGDSVRMTAK